MIQKYIASYYHVKMYIVFHIIVIFKSFQVFIFLKKVMKNIGYTILRILLDIESWHFRVDKINEE
jgi:hypothetical protein